MSHTKIIYHIVFSTKKRKAVLLSDKRDHLYRYIWGILQKKKCHLYRIGGIEDHLHILTSLHPTVSLADLVKTIKLGSSHMIKEKNLFHDFLGWQNGYGAFTHFKNYLIEYVKNQEVHHHKIPFEQEYRTLLTDSDIDFDEKYLFD